MPLQQVSANAPSGDSRSSLRHKISASSSSTFERPRAPPLAVQSMLRSTTEMGDIMPLTRSNGLISRPGSRVQSTRPRSGSFDSSFASALRHLHSPRNRPRHRRLANHTPVAGTRLPRYNTAQSDLSSYIRTPRNGRPRLKLNPSHHQGITSPRLPSRAIHNHRSIVTLRSHGDAASRYSGSSTRSVRTDFLPRRAWNQSDKHRSNGWGKRAGNALDRSFVSPPRRLQTPFTSTSTSILGSPPRNVAIRTMKGWQDGTGSVLSSIKSNQDAALVSRNSTFSQSFSVQPRYYDYSESFLEEYESMPESPHNFRSHFVHPEVTKLGLSYNMQPTRSVSNCGLGSPVLPAELPTEYNLKSKDDLTRNTMREEGGEDSESFQVPARLKPPEPSTDFEEQKVRERNTNQERFELEANVRRFSAASRRTCTSTKSGIFFHNGEKSQRDLPLLVARVHSPDPESEKVQDASLSGIQTSCTPDIPNLKSDNKSGHTLSLLMRGRPRTSPVEVCRGDTEIVSPQPERPVSSQSRRQFKRIIEIDQDHKDTSDRSMEDLQMRSWFSVPSMLKISQPDYGVVDEASSSKSIDNRENVLNQHRPLSEIRTPDQVLQLSTVLSQGKSTIDLLLESHIKCLGLMPETETLSGSSEIEDSLGYTSHDEAILIASNQHVRSSDESQQHLSTARISQSSSLSSHTRIKMKPRKLFASQDGTITAFPESLHPASEDRSLSAANNRGYFSFGWQTLPSDSQTFTRHSPSKYTLTSGEMADIDTDLYPLGRQVWRLSQMSLPTTEDGCLMLSPTTRCKLYHQRRRSHSDISTKQDLQSHRRLKVHMKLQCKPEPLTKLTLPLQMDVPEQSNDLPRSNQLIHEVQNTGLGDAQVCERKTSPSSNQQGDNDLLVPNRWSGIIAAMPMPGTGKPIFPRIVSTRTQTSYRSGRSQASLAERLNSTRQRSHIPQIGSVIPRLAPPDLGPPLEASTLNLSVPYAEIPSTILLSKQNTESFFNHSSPSKQSPQKVGRRRFGLRPQLNRTRGTRAGLMPPKTALPMRNGIPIPAVGSSNTGPSKSYFRHETFHEGAHTMHVDDLAHSRKRTLSRFKDWWRKQCLHKAMTRKSQNVQSMPERLF